MEQLLKAIPAILKDLEPNAGATEAMAFAAWNNTAGEMLASRTKPIEFSGKRLVVGVEDKTWQRNLESLSASMLAKLNDALGHGSVRFIEFRIANLRSHI